MICLRAFDTSMDDARCRCICAVIESQDTANSAQESSSVSDSIAISLVPTHSASNMSCHSYHLVSLLKMSKPSEPLKGDAHEENTFCSHKLSGWRALRGTMRQISFGLVSFFMC